MKKKLFPMEKCFDIFSHTRNFHEKNENHIFPLSFHFFLIELNHTYIYVGIQIKIGSDQNITI